MATIKDVAKLANVSVATVSRVINQDDKVTEKTKEIVLLAIQTLNYSPNNLARNLRRLESKKILVLLRSISNPFFSLVVKGIEDATKHEYDVMIGTTHGNPEVELRYCELIKTKVVDGAIFLNSMNDGNELTKMLSPFPCMQAIEYNEKFLKTCVTIDNEMAAFDATEFLINKGFKRIAFLGAGGIKGSSADRKIGYLKALSKNGIEIIDELIIDGGFTFSEGVTLTEELLKLGNLPEAIFCVSDELAAGVIKTLIENNVSVPEKISVIGFDDTAISKAYIPSITTTRQPQYEMGFRAGELLIEQIKLAKNSTEHLPTCGTGIADKIIYEHKIIERKSTL